MPQPTRAFTDGAGDVWLALDNGHRIRLPLKGSSNGSGGPSGGSGGTDEVWIGDEPPESTDYELWVDTNEDALTDYVLTTGDTMTGELEFTGPRHTTGMRFHEAGALATDHRFIGLRTGSTGTIGLGTFKPADDPSSPLTLTPFAVAAPGLPEHAVSLAYLNAGRQVTITPTAPFADYASTYAGIWATGVGALTTLEGLVKVTVSTAITAGVSYPVLTIPTGWRPDHDFIFTSLLAPAGGATFAPVRMTIVAATGVMSMVSPTAQTYATNGWMPVGCTYRST